MNESREERWARYKAEAEKTMTTICDHVANGGTVIELAKIWDLPYNQIINWVQTDENRNKRYVESLHARAEWAKERVLQEVRTIALLDIRKLFNEDGSMKPTSEWPEDIARAIAGLEINELWDGVGEDRAQVGVTKKVKLIDKTRSLEMLMKNLAMLVERVDHSGKLTLGDIVAESQKPVEKKDTSNE